MVSNPISDHQWQAIDVMVVDDHQMIRILLARLLEENKQETGIQVVGTVASGEEALEKIHRLRPDVVLMDLNMPGIGGLEATVRIIKAQPGTKVVVFTVLEDGPYPYWLLSSGASGYLSKGCHVDEIVQAIKMAFVGERYISPTIASNLVENLMKPSETPSLLRHLSTRECQILTMLVKGENSKTISGHLNLSPKTVSTYKVRLREKLNCRTDAELFRMAAQLGLINSDISQ